MDGPMIVDVTEDYDHGYEADDDDDGGGLTFPDGYETIDDEDVSGDLNAATTDQQGGDVPSEDDSGSSRGGRHPLSLVKRLRSLRLPRGTSRCTRHHSGGNDLSMASGKLIIPERHEAAPAILSSPLKRTHSEDDLTDENVEAQDRGLERPMYHVNDETTILGPHSQHGRAKRQHRHDGGDVSKQVGFATRSSLPVELDFDTEMQSDADDAVVAGSVNVLSQSTTSASPV